MSTGELDALLLMWFPWNSKQHIARSSADAMEFKLNVQSVYKRGTQLQANFFDVAHTNKMATMTKDVLIHAHCHKLRASEMQKTVYIY